MIIPVGKTFVVLPHATHAVSTGSASSMPLPVKIIFFVILFLFFIGVTAFTFDIWRDVFMYRHRIEADDIMAMCFSSATWIALLILCISIWFA